MGNTLGLGAGAGLGLGLCFGAAALMQAVGANAEHLNRGREAHANRVVNPQRQYNVHRAEDIDESSAERLYDAMRYAKANAMLIQVPVLGTAKKFWRLSDKATRISRKLALILSSQHKIGKYLTAPLQLSDVWIGNNGSVKLRGVSFTDTGFSIERVRDDYKYLAKVLIKLIKFSGGDISNLPPDYREFLLLIGRGTVTMRDEFLIVNNVALLPMENRTEVFLMLHDRIVNYRGREDEAKRKRILSKLPYKKDWLDTARANARINEWVTFPKKGMNQGVENVREYRRTPFDLLRLNRNIRCHLHQHNNDDIEETLYCEWPELLMVMEKMLYLEGELVATDIQNKFG
ncbi:hypothetical protein SEVIR_1G131900v4 [Setaria viridis]|uniref:O-fucosyltransferase family protein n=2 Tax=Setaria viridis TaxID=4556 RepID=A0A4U6WAM9_SETVI|nr:uncharacterized protein LOC117841414 [Setaria viridis]TKW38683.1 hypothetical protein SEVIR_1G131900v2 [Setaria viridis]